MSVFDLLNEHMKSSKAYVAGGKQLNNLVEGYPLCKLNANENQLGASKKVIEAMIKEMDKIHLYPFDEVMPTKKALADWLGFEVENINIGSGSLSLIQAIGDVFLNPGDEMIMGNPSYMAYASMPKPHGASTVMVDTNDYACDVYAMLKAINKKTKLVVLVNPNNPTGARISNEDLDYFVNNVPEHVITIIDEAYIEWVDDPKYRDALHYVRENKNVVVLRTFSKVFGMAGIRFGYSITTKEIATCIGYGEGKYAPNRLALVGARAAIKDEEHLQYAVKVNTEGRKYITEELESLGFEVVPSYTSFVFFSPNTDAQKFNEELEKYNVYIRDFGKKYTRVSIGTMDQNRQFICAVKEIIKK